MNQEEYWFWFSNIPNLYQHSMQKLLQVFHDPKEIFQASEEALLGSGCVDAGRAHEIVCSRSHFRSLYKLEKLHHDGIRFIYYGSEDYPECFLVLEDKPLSFYVKGELPDPDRPSAGIVGARQCSGYGKEMTLRYAQTLAANGVQIISGMALGVDSYASRGAMEAGGKTFAVLGSGLDVIYPQQNIELYYQIVLSGGGVISEYPMGTAPIGWQFPHRNRLISAFSDRLLVMEARGHSGTLTTAAYALAQGKDVYALPGRTTDPLSEGCNRMIADGAGVLLDPKELLEEIYGGGRYTREPENGTDAGHLSAKVARAAGDSQEGSAAMTPGISGPAGSIYQCLSYEPQTVDSIARISGSSQEETARQLTELELEGLCVQVVKDYYALS